MRGPFLFNIIKDLVEGATDKPREVRVSVKACHHTYSLPFALCFNSTVNTCKVPCMDVIALVSTSLLQQIVESIWLKEDERMNMQTVLPHKRAILPALSKASTATLVNSPSWPKMLLISVILPLVFERKTTLGNSLRKRLQRSFTAWDLPSPRQLKHRILICLGAVASQPPPWSWGWNYRKHGN